MEELIDSIPYGWNIVLVITILGIFGIGYIMLKEIVKG